MALEGTKVGQADGFGAAVIAAAYFTIATGCCMEKVQGAQLFGLRHDIWAVLIIVDIRDIWQ